MNNAERPSASSFPLTNNSVNYSPETGNGARNVVQAGEATSRAGRIWTVTRWTLAVTFCLLCITGGTVFGFFWQNSSLFRSGVGEIIKNPGVALTHLNDPLAVFKPELQLPPEKQNVINILLLGCDYDYDPRRPIAIKTTNGRSDAMMLARVDFERESVNILSIPRDTAVYIPRHGIHKINSAHAIGGPELAQETLKEVFGLDTDYYVRVNFDAFEDVVDAIGGVDVNVKKSLHYDDNWGNLHIHLEPGLQHLNGYKAMGYVRMRHTDSDFARAERQHEFLEAVRTKVKSRETFLKLPQALDALMANIKSNMTDVQMLTVANFVRTLDPSKIKLETLPSIPGPSYVYVDVPKSEEVLRRLFYDGLYVPITINVPDRSSFVAVNRNNGKRKKRKANPALDVNAPKDDDGAPLLLDEEATNSNPEAPASNPEAGTSTTEEGSPTGTPGEETGKRNSPAPPDGTEKKESEQKPNTGGSAEYGSVGHDPGQAQPG